MGRIPLAETWETAGVVISCVSNLVLNKSATSRCVIAIFGLKKVKWVHQLDRKTLTIFGLIK